MTTKSKLETNKLLAKALTEDICQVISVDLGYYIGQKKYYKDNIFDTKAEIYRVILERLNNGCER